MEAEKKEQLLLIDPPHELKFRGPFTRPVMTVMILTNPTDQNILFKIKTTAPRKYCVRPNFGLIAPRSKIQVEICLQAFVLDPNEKNKHKFMVQSYIVPEGVDNHLKLLKEVDPDQFMNSKLRCVFEQPVESSAGGDSATGEATKENASKAGGDEISQDIQVNFKLAAAEVGQLREEASQLRQENLKLKEQLLRLRLNTEANQKEKTSTSSSSSYQNPYSPPQIGQQQVPVMYIILAIGMALFGLLLGKYFL